jgi:chromosome partitioning protein
MGQIIALANQKGGVGKTTTTLNLGAALAARGRKVLLIDGDPQSNLTEGCGLDPYKQDATTYDVLLNPKKGATFAIQTLRPQQVARAAGANSGPQGNGAASVSFDLIPTTPDMAAVEIELMSQTRREEKLRTALASVRNAYDFILIDPPPSLGLLTINILTAADWVRIPLQVHVYSLRGLALLQRTVGMVAEELNSTLTIGGVVCTMTDRRNNLSQTVEATIRSKLGDIVYKTTIPQNVKLAEAPASGKPILFYDAASAGARAYTALAEEVDRG